MKKILRKTLVAGALTSLITLSACNSTPNGVDKSDNSAESKVSLSDNVNIEFLNDAKSIIKAKLLYFKKTNNGSMVSFELYNYSNESVKLETTNKWFDKNKKILDNSDVWKDTLVLKKHKSYMEFKTKNKNADAFTLYLDIPVKDEE